MLISVVTAASRSASVLERLRKQFSSQSFRDFEHIVIYDGKAPGDVVEYFTDEIARDSRCVFEELPEKEGKYGTAPRNRGIELSRGDFIIFADDDDLYHPDYLKSFVELGLDENTLGVVRINNYGTVIPRHDISEFPRYCHVGTSSCCYPSWWFRKRTDLRWKYDGNYSHDFEFVKACVDIFHPTIKLNPRVVVRATNEQIMLQNGIIGKKRERYLNWKEPNRWLRLFSPAISDRPLPRMFYKLGEILTVPRAIIARGK